MNRYKIILEIETFENQKDLNSIIAGTLNNVDSIDTFKVKIKKMRKRGKWKQNKREKMKYGKNILMI